MKKYLGKHLCPMCEKEYPSCTECGGSGRECDTAAYMAHPEMSCHHCHGSGWEPEEIAKRG